MFTDPSTKHQKIFHVLQSEIVSGKYSSGQKLPSEAALVKRFGVSRITAGRAVRDLRQAGLVERRAGSGTYVRQPGQSEPGKGYTFGLLIPNLGQTDIFEHICQGMAEAAGEHALLWGRAARDDASRPAEALRLCEQYIARQVSGIFFAPLESGSDASSANMRILAALDAARIPIVLLDRDPLPHPRRSPYDLVGIHNRRAGYLAAQHLIQAGARRIAFWGYSHAASTIDARLFGYRQALEGAHMEPSLYRYREPTPEAVRRALDAGADAFVCGNDRVAGALMHVILNLGHRIPGDVRIVGIDDVGYARLLPVPLTTVRQPCRDIGLAAISAMQDRLRHPTLPARDILLAAPLIIRASCGAPPQDSASRMSAPASSDPEIPPQPAPKSQMPRDPLAASATPHQGELLF